MFLKLKWVAYNSGHSVNNNNNSKKIDSYSIFCHIFCTMSMYVLGSLLRRPFFHPWKLFIVFACSTHSLLMMVVSKHALETCVCVCVRACLCSLMYASAYYLVATQRIRIIYELFYRYILWNVVIYKQRKQWIVWNFVWLDILIWATFTKWIRNFELPWERNQYIYCGYIFGYSSSIRFQFHFHFPFAPRDFLDRIKWKRNV